MYFKSVRALSRHQEYTFAISMLGLVFTNNPSTNARIGAITRIHTNTEKHKCKHKRLNASASTRIYTNTEKRNYKHKDPIALILVLSLAFPGVCMGSVC